MTVISAVVDFKPKQGLMDAFGLSSSVLLAFEREYYRRADAAQEEDEDSRTQDVFMEMIQQGAVPDTVLMYLAAKGLHQLWQEDSPALELMANADEEMKKAWEDS